MNYWIYYYLILKNKSRKYEKMYQTYGTLLKDQTEKISLDQGARIQAKGTEKSIWWRNINKAPKSCKRHGDTGTGGILNPIQLWPEKEPLHVIL